MVEKPSERWITHDADHERTGLRVGKFLVRFDLEDSLASLDCFKSKQESRNSKNIVHRVVLKVKDYKRSSS